MENYEQFLTSKDAIKSLEIIKQHMIDEVNNNLAKLNMTNLNYTNFILPIDINELDKNSQYLLISISHLCESISIIESKLGAQNG